MDELRDSLLMMTEQMKVYNDYFFNLLDVLASKHILTKNDLRYIRYHKDTKEQNND